MHNFKKDYIYEYHSKWHSMSPVYAQTLVVNIGSSLRHFYLVYSYNSHWFHSRFGQYYFFRQRDVYSGKQLALYKVVNDNDACV